MTPNYPDIHIIVGSARSGTTYLTWTLRLSLDIGFPAEPKFIIPIYHQLHRFGNLEQAANLRRLVETIHKGSVFDHLHRVIGVPSRPEEILERVQEPTYTGVLYAVFQLLAEKRNCSRLGYKDPFDVTHLPLLAQLFPTARFIHIIRDGRDVALSFLKFLWGPTTLYCGARHWGRVVSAGRRDGADLGSRYFELQFEDLVTNPDKTAAELGEFINKGNHPEQVQNFVERINRTRKPGNVQVWKQNMTENQRYLCEAAAGDMLRACDYPTEFDPGASILGAKKGILSDRRFRASRAKRPEAATEVNGTLTCSPKAEPGRIRGIMTRCSVPPCDGAESRNLPPREALDKHYPGGPRNSGPPSRSRPDAIVESSDPRDPPWRQVMGQYAPRAAATQDIEELHLAATVSI
jgi:Sulfotransferase family